VILFAQTPILFKVALPTATSILRSCCRLLRFQLRQRARDVAHAPVIRDLSVSDAKDVAGREPSSGDIILNFQTVSLALIASSS
jgi:hypothetical protein